MNFYKALQVSNIKERNARIESLIENHSWEDVLEDHLSYGGWPEDIVVDKIEIDEDESTGQFGELSVVVWVSFSESIASSCKDYNHSFNMTAHFLVLIDRSTGSYDIRNVDVVEDGGDNESNDYYPDDYN